MKHLNLLYALILLALLPGCFNAKVEHAQVEHTTPEATFAWQQFIDENKARQKYAVHSDLAVYSGIIKVTTSPHYTTLHELQRVLEQPNKQCAQFYDHKQLHMTLLYIHIPIEHNLISNEQEMIGILSKDLAAMIEQYASLLSSVSFECVGTQMLGKTNNFITATFTPLPDLAHLQEQFMLPFGTSLFTKYPHAWFSFLEDPTFHISLAKLKPHCTTRDIKIPMQLPPVDTYQLKTGTLKVSLHGPTRKPYYKKVPGWHHQKFKT